MRKKLAIAGFVLLVVAVGVWLWTSFPAPLPTVPHTRRAVPDASGVLPSSR